MLKEYVITLHQFEDLDNFYDDMESPGGSLYIPNRKVDLALRRPISRNTHYMLSEEEAVQLKNDSRVAAVELTPAELGIVARPMWTDSSNSWSKSGLNSTDKNWALLRCTEGQQRSSWGTDGTANQSGTVTVTSEGRNVDVVIVDGIVNPNHPEFAVNNDGSGGSRVIQYNWFQHNLGSGTGTYLYGPYSSADAIGDNNHGAHVAGTVAGNSQGWARKANIYNITPYGTDVNALSDLLIFDYIRAFHANKSTNPVTGRRNPTICNNSWGYTYTLSINDITNIFYRGAYVGGAPYDQATLLNYGIFNNGVNAYTLARYSALEADITDAMNDGILMVGAASNFYGKIDVPAGQDYNNFYVWSGYAVPYHQGGAPSATPNMLCVGSIGTTSAETKSSFSMCGPRVDVYAPGSGIMSSVNSGGTTDSRNASYNIDRYSGTSMASPQVCGVLACALEIYPSMTQAQARSYIIDYAKTNQITDTGGGGADFTSLQGSVNRYLYYYKERVETGSVFPKRNYWVRPSSGSVYPRNRIKKII
jgi:hypothetical protein